MRNRLGSLLAILVTISLLPLQAIAGTTGGITGRVVDARTQAPIAGVTVTASSPSQQSTTTSDATGTYRFLSLTPDTYTITFSAAGYDTVSQPGISVFADQTQTNNVSLTKTLKTIAHVTSQAASNLVKSGTTSDVYSVNSAQQQATQGLTGPGSLNNAYGAIQSVPGVQLDSGEVGWWQTLHIRGGDIDQVGYELDGIPVNRAYDNAPQTMLSSLGSNEVEVYTGGVPASSDAQGLSGYVNQVIKTGTYPGYADGTLSAGYPAFYHQASIEAGGATPDRLFSYYVGIGGSNQTFNYVNYNQGSNIPSSFFYPVNALPGSNGYVYTGPPQPGLFTNGLAFGLVNQSLRDSIVNVHFGIPHKGNGLRDDVQALWMTSENVNWYYSSQSDLGSAVLAAICNISFASSSGCNPQQPLTWDDTHGYSGAPMQPFNQADVYKYYFPQSQPHPFQGPLPLTIRDPNDNGVSVSKLQFQHVFSPSSYLRVYGYAMYSNWFINGYNSGAQPYYGWELPYFLPDHTYGLNVSYENQLSSQHLLTVTGSYTASNLTRYDTTYLPGNWAATNYVGKNGKCYDPASGAQIGCYDQTAGTILAPIPATPPPNLCSTKPLPAACAAGVDPQWLVTNTTWASPTQALNQVGTRFSGYSIGDQWSPGDKLNVNLGMRLEDFEYVFGNTSPNDPARQFWFNAYNAEFCFAPGTNNSKPVDRTNNGTGPCPAGTHPLAVQPQDPAGTTPSVYGPLVNTSGGQYTAARFEPRLGVTYTLDPNSVLRASFGIYARPPNSSWVQYNTVAQDLPAYLGSHFYGYGFNTPDHIIRPDTSYNYDLSWEHRLKGTDWSFKISPFFRATRDQLQNFFIDPQGGLESGLNVGAQQTDGVEFALQKGDLSRNGLSGMLSFTFTHSQIRYQNFSGTSQNVIDQLNGYIKQYNAFTKAGGGSRCYSYAPGSYSSGAGTNNCNQPGVIVNPYYGNPAQPLFDPGAWYTTYDVIPGPVSGENGYAVPYVTTLLLNYKRDKFTVTNTWNFNSGASYGAPTAWPGYIPTSCSKPSAAWMASYGKAADPASCNDFVGLPLFIPDPYTHQYDTLGAFKQPWQLQMGLAFSYEVSPRVTARLGFSNILDICGQRGYAWDNPWVCVYSNPPTGFFYPQGNFYPNSQSKVAPAQMQYPYDFWFNGNNTGFLGVVQPMQVTGSLTIRI